LDPKQIKAGGRGEGLRRKTVWSQKGGTESRRGVGGGRLVREWKFAPKAANKIKAVSWGGRLERNAT